MRLRNSFLVVLAIGLAAVLAGPGQGMLPGRTLLPLDLLHQVLLPWGNDVKQPVFNDHFNIDAVQEYLPRYQFQAESLRRGELPTWNPFNRGGTAELDNPVHVPFHPLKLLLRFVSPAQMFDLLAVIHFALAFVAMAAYLRHLGLAAPAVLYGALCWAFCGFFVMNFVHERVIGAYGLLPLCLMLAERAYARPGPRTACWFGLALGLSLLISDPTAILVYLLVFSARLVGFWWFESSPLDRARLTWLAAAGALAFCVAAPNLLSSLEGLLTNVRVFDYAERRSLTGALGTVAGAYLALLVSAIHPYALGSRDSVDVLKLVGQTLTMTPLAGGFSLLFLAFAARRLRDDRALRWLLLLTAVGLVLLLPPVARVWSTRNVIVLTFVVAVGGALGMHRLLTAKPAELRGSARLVVAFALAVWAAFLLREAVLLVYGDAIAQAIRQGIEARLPGNLMERYGQWNAGRTERLLALQHLWSLPNVLFLASLTLLAVAWKRFASSGRRTWGFVVLAVASISPVAYMLDNVHVVDTRQYPVPASPDYLALRGADPSPPRVAIPRQDREDRLLMPGLLPQLFHLAQLQGQGSVFPLGPAVLTGNLPYEHPLYEELGVNYLITARDSSAAIPAAFPVAVYRGEVNIHAREPLVSRFRLVDRLAPAASRQEAAERARADARPGAEREYYLTRIPEDFRGPTAGSYGVVRVLRDEPTLIELETSAQHGRLLVAGTTYYPGWRATVDGKAAEILPVDGAIQGVWLPPGTHGVRLEYVHWPSRIGFGLQLLALAFLAAGAMRARARARPPVGDRPRTGNLRP